MVDSKPDDGPKVVWTFPLFRRVSQRRRLLDIGSNVRDAVNGDGPLRNVGSNISASANSSSEDGDGDYSETHTEVGGGDTSDIENDIEDVKDSSSTVFGTDELDGAVYAQLDEEGVVEVSIEGEVFVPTRAEVDAGDTVRWVNNSDSLHRISSISGDEMMSEQLSPGDTYEHKFTSEGVTVYIDSITGGSNMSGAVIVGDVDSDVELPSESDTQPVTFDGDSSSTTRSMSAAADDKEDMDIGFSD